MECVVNKNVAVALLCNKLYPPLIIPFPFPRSYPVLFFFTIVSISASISRGGDRLSPWNVPRLISTCPKLSPPDISSVFHCSILFSRRLVMLSTTPNMVIYTCGTISKVFLKSIQAIQSPVSLLSQFLIIILSINNWSFVPPIFLRQPFCSLGKSLLLSRCWYISSDIAPVSSLPH